MILSLVSQDNSILQQVCKKIDIIDESIKKLAQNLIETAQANNGIGLAAPQIGESIQMFVTLTDNNPRVFINPIIHMYGRETINNEGCLSVPDFLNSVIRSTRVKITFRNLKGELNSLKAKGLLARVIQHEYDHLCGTLIKK